MSPGPPGTPSRSTPSTQGAWYGRDGGQHGETQPGARRSAAVPSTLGRQTGPEELAKGQVTISRGPTGLSRWTNDKNSCLVWAPHPSVPGKSLTPGKRARLVSLPAPSLSSLQPRPLTPQGLSQMPPRPQARPAAKVPDSMGPLSSHSGVTRDASTACPERTPPHPGTRKGTHSSPDAAYIPARPWGTWPGPCHRPPWR